MSERISQEEYLKIDQASPVRHEYYRGKMWPVGKPPGRRDPHWSDHISMAAKPDHYITAEEYLKLDRAAEFKSEYYKGKMFAMAGGTVPRAMIIGNLTGLLFSALAKKGCAVMPNDLRVQVAEGDY
jgi:hypothetical protein